ncbi:heavy-metal-associated domain-containing protein [Chamaesiphon sp.]|uniref:heavy-metal-associated domain-containing protein n=1 Tax=Chamaesiphon sp. TaxID=2814140 RepID=UPI003593EF95
MQTTFTVPDLACGACVEKITQAIQAIDPQAQIVASSQTKLVQIESELPAIALQATIVDAGYTIGR